MLKRHGFSFLNPSQFRNTPTHNFNTMKFPTIIFLFALSSLHSQAIETYPITPKAFSSNRFELNVDGAPLLVQKFKDIHYAHFPHSGEESVSIVVEIRRPFMSAEIGPKLFEIPLEVNPDTKTLKFELKKAGNYVLTLDNKERLFVFAEAPEYEFPEGSSIIEYGADPSGKTRSTDAIQKAIDGAGPGSTVRVPPGHYVSGSLFIKTGVTLFLEPGSLLQASTDPNDFESVQNAFIVIDNAENVSLRGKGTIDGSGAYLRNFTAESGRLLSIRDSRDVTIEGVILRDPRAWNTHIIRSENISLRNVKILNDRYISNTDGINPDSSRHVLIENSFFYCGDDAVAVKSTNRDGQFQDVYDIIIRNNIILTKKSALKVGTESHASEMKDITFENNMVIECDRGMAIYARDGTHVHDVRFIGNHFEKHYPDYNQQLLHFLVQKRHGLSRVSDILVKDCVIYQPWPRSSLIRGLQSGHGISNITFVNFTYDGELCISATDANLKIGDHVKNVEFKTTKNKM